jgi:hypothetical protein
MGKIDLFKIELKKTNPVYFGGETLEGNLNIITKKRFKINELRLIIKGYSLVFWYILS